MTDPERYQAVLRGLGEFEIDAFSTATATRGIPARPVRGAREGSTQTSSAGAAHVPLIGRASGPRASRRSTGPGEFLPTGQLTRCGC